MNYRSIINEYSKYKLFNYHQGLFDFILRNYQIELIRRFDNHSINVVYSARQKGITTLLTYYSHSKAMQGNNILVISPRKIMNVTQRKLLCANNSHNVLNILTEKDNEIKLINTSIITYAVPSQVMSHTINLCKYDIVIVDEAAYMPLRFRDFLLYEITSIRKLILVTSIDLLKFKIKNVQGIGVSLTEFNGKTSYVTPYIK